MTRVLLIDDDQDVRTLLQRMLTGAGYEVTAACDGVDGLRQFRANPQDVVITDLIMPEKEGLETIRELLEIRPDLPIIAISGGGRVDAGNYLKMAEGLGASATLAKPFGRAELIDTLEMVFPTVP